MLWKRGEIAPKKQFLHFSRIFSIYLYLQESNYISICYMWFLNLLFSSLLHLLYFEVRISRSVSESSLEFEITGVDCILKILQAKRKVLR